MAVVEPELYGRNHYKSPHLQIYVRIAIRVSLSKSSPSDVSSINIVCAYLPSSDHPMDEYTEYLNDLASIVSSLESHGPVIILGDLNAHLHAPTNHRGDLLREVIKNYNLCIACTSCIAKGPGYTFFSGDLKTTVDYILLNTSFCHAIVDCHTHDHHILNFSDHLPVSVLLSIENLIKTQSERRPKVNWRKSAEDGLTVHYAQEVSDIIYSLSSCEYQSITELNDEIVSVSNTLTYAASKHLTFSPHRNTKPYIKDSELRSLCKESRKAWERWRSAGHPLVGRFYDEKRDTKKKVRQFVASCRARKERATILARDSLFREKNLNRFKSSNRTAECKGLKINNCVCTDPQEIANLFSEYFGNLATSLPSKSLTDASLTSLILKPCLF